MPAYRNAVRKKKNRNSWTCESETAVDSTCQIPPWKSKSNQAQNFPLTSRNGPLVTKRRLHGPHEYPPPSGPSESTTSSFPVNPVAEDRSETVHETASSVSFTPTVSSQEQPAVGRARRRRPSSVPTYSPPSYPPPLSPFSSSCTSSPVYHDSLHSTVMPSPHRPMAFHSVDKYPSHYPSTPQGSPGRPLPPSSMVSNSPVPPITSPSMWPSNQYSSSSFYGSTNPDTVLSPFNYSQGSFGSDSIGSQNPSPAALPPSSFNGDSPAPRADLFLNDMNEGHAIEQPSAAGDPFGDFLDFSAPLVPVLQGASSYEDEHHPHYLTYGSSLRHAVDPDAVFLGNASTPHHWGSWPDPEPSALFRPPNA